MNSLEPIAPAKLNQSGEADINDIPPAIATQAVEWLIEWQTADDPEPVWQALCQWCQQHPLHQEAWQQIEMVNQKFDLLAAPEHKLATQHALTTTAATPASLSRRDAIKTLSLVAIVGSAGWLTTSRKPWQSQLADYQTATGEQRQIILADGTEITLNSATAIDIQIRPTERRIVLIKGEIYIRTGNKPSNPDQPPTPFIVQVAQGELRPLGTRFSVRQMDQHCRVAVYQGQVNTAPRNHPRSVVVEPGQSLTFTPESWLPAGGVAASDAAWAWGMIVANNMRLDDFLTELNRHRHGYIQCAAEVAQLKISGTYPLDQTDEVLSALASALPIKVRSLTRYWIRVVAADNSDPA